MGEVNSWRRGGGRDGDRRDHGNHSGTGTAAGREVIVG